MGIGYEIALQFAQHKTDILIIARNDQKLQAMKHSVEKEYQIKVYTLAVDLSTPESIEVIRTYVSCNPKRRHNPLPPPYKRLHTRSLAVVVEPLVGVFVVDDGHGGELALFDGPQIVLS